MNESACKHLALIGRDATGKSYRFFEYPIDTKFFEMESDFEFLVREGVQNHHLFQILVCCSCGEVRAKSNFSRWGAISYMKQRNYIHNRPLHHDN